MMNSISICGMLFMLTCISAQAVEPAKKGVGLWPFEGAEKGLENIGVSWYYNWATDSSLGVDRKVEFIPMIWSNKFATTKNFHSAKNHSDTLLAFNEPDHKDQANMSVELAIKLWPQLEATGMRLGSPATASDADKPDRWFGKFMKQCKEKGYKVDFICVHRYENNYSDPVAGSRRLETFLKTVHQLYGKPIWLTEFAMADWKDPASPRQQQAYMAAVLPMLESLTFLERYAWFALPPNPNGDGGALAGSNLCDNKGKLNSLGEFYQNPQSNLPLP